MIKNRKIFFCNLLIFYNFFYSLISLDEKIFLKYFYDLYQKLLKYILIVVVD